MQRTRHAAFRSTPGAEDRIEAEQVVGLFSRITFAILRRRKASETCYCHPGLMDSSTSAGIIEP